MGGTQHHNIIFCDTLITIYETITGTIHVEIVWQFNIKFKKSSSNWMAEHESLRADCQKKSKKSKSPSLLSTGKCYLHRKLVINSTK